MYNILKIIGRKKELFIDDINLNEEKLRDIISCSTFLVIGGGGTIGQSTVKEIFKRNPLKLYVVDISENNLAELVRDIRSSFGYIKGEFKTFAIDILSREFDVFFKSEGIFNYILNFSALKHVRSERDPFTLMRMLQTNNASIENSLNLAIEKGTKKYFAVSTDKAANPVNLMGATKRIMEKILFSKSDTISVSTARFANVAFSDGSLLHGFNMRIMKEQPLAGPSDIKRYFVTPKESGRLCLMSALLGNNRNIFFPKLNNELDLIDFKSIASEFLMQKGLKPIFCDSEEEARAAISVLRDKNCWPCYFEKSDTTGEKPFEEFYTSTDNITLDIFKEIGIIDKNFPEKNTIDKFLNELNNIYNKNCWNKIELVDLIFSIIPELKHEEKNRYLDGKM